MRFSTLVLVAVLPWTFLAFTGCGGSGGGNSVPPTPFSADGTYWSVGGFARASEGRAESRWSRPIVLNGVVNGSDTTNNGSTISPPGISTLGTPFVVDANRNILVGDDPETLTGRISADGKIFHLSTLDTSAPAVTSFAIRLGGSHSTASVDETYAMIQVMPGDSVTWGLITFDGQGGYTGSLSQADGANVSAIAASGTYDVASMGEITFTPGGGTNPPSIGCVGEGGNYIAIAGPTVDATKPMYALFVRIAPGNATPALFAGSYKEHSFGFDPLTPYAISRHATIVANGVSTFSMTGEEQRDDTIVSVSKLDNAFTVSGNGSMSLTYEDLPFWGHVAESDGVAIYAGPSASSLRPRAGLLIR